jgi:hypothetical protein
MKRTTSLVLGLAALIGAALPAAAQQSSSAAVLFDGEVDATADVAVRSALLGRGMTVLDRSATDAILAFQPRPSAGWDAGAAERFRATSSAAYVVVIEAKATGADQRAVRVLVGGAGGYLTRFAMAAGVEVGPAAARAALDALNALSGAAAPTPTVSPAVAVVAPSPAPTAAPPAAPPAAPALQQGAPAMAPTATAPLEAPPASPPPVDPAAAGLTAETAPEARSNGIIAVDFLIQDGMKGFGVGGCRTFGGRLCLGGKADYFWADSISSVRGISGLGLNYGDKKVRFVPYAGVLYARTDAELPTGTVSASDFAAVVGFSGQLSYFSYGMDFYLTGGTPVILRLGLALDLGSSGL